MYVNSEKTNKNTFGTLSLQTLSSSSTERCYTIHVLYLIKQKRTNFKTGKIEAKNSKNFQFRACRFLLCLSVISILVHVFLCRRCCLSHYSLLNCGVFLINYSASYSSCSSSDPMPSSSWSSPTTEAMMNVTGTLHVDAPPPRRNEFPTPSFWSAAVSYTHLTLPTNREV